MTSSPSHAFLPVLLGTDINAYGVARNIHENYDVTSLCVGRQALRATAHSRIVSVRTNPDFESDEAFLSTLHALASEFPDLPKILIPCGDYYSELISRHREDLAGDYLFNVPDYEMNQQLENKIDFYRICEEYNLAYPTTIIAHESDMADFADFVAGLDIKYPVAFKPDDSADYLRVSFEGKKKAFIIDSAEELTEIGQRIYAAGYRGAMVIQDFIPGGPESMAVLNAYVDTSGNVRMMCLGQCVLDDNHPIMIGNYLSLVTIDGSDIYPTFENFLRTINYRGYANFDLKFDSRDGTYKVFEINLRQGLSSYHMAAGGCEYMTYLVDDLLATDDAPRPATHYHTSTGKLWTRVAPAVISNYAPSSLTDLIQEATRHGRVYTNLYRRDLHPLRLLDHVRTLSSGARSYRYHASKDR